ncbi:MAG: hypothetical protein M1368_07210, partial [Thaumarchaeota archaeon]|nr:hypothetical protein [Nitrososphaerota archaeon]
MRKQLVLLLLVIFAISISTLFGTHLFGYSVAEATQSATACDSTLAVNSAFGTVSGSGNYPCGSGAAFGVTPTIITDGDVRHVFSGWTCSGAGCYSGSADSAFVTMGGNNSAITESAEWIAEYLLTLTASPSDSGNTNPAGSIWEVAGSVVQVNQQAVAAGWFFAYWSTDFAADAGSSSSYSITMDSPHAITANFIKLNITTELINVTSAASGLNLRNPDGTFYHGDEFQISSSIFVAGGGPLPNSIVPLVAYSYSSQVLTQLSIHQNGTSEFQVSDSAAYAPQTITATAYLKNEIDNVVIQSPATSSEPFAIVQYRPYFSDFTYMEYNNISSS